MAMTSLPYENATSGRAALVQIEKMLRAFGVQSFGSYEDFQTNELVVHFKHRDRRVMVRASARGYAALWKKIHPWTRARRCAQAEWDERALETGRVAVHSILRDWIKGQTTAIEVGMLTFESAFLPHIVMPDGGTVMDRVTRENLLQLERSPA